MTEAVASIAQIEIYGTATLDFSGTTNFFDIFAGCKVYLDQNITYITSESIMGIIAAKGTRTFSGRELVRLFSYRGWKKGEYDRTYFVSKSFAAVVDQNLSGGTPAKYTGYYSRIVNKVSTDISATDFEDVKKYIFYLAGCNWQGDGISKIYKILPPASEDGTALTEGFVVSDATLPICEHSFRNSYSF